MARAGVTVRFDARKAKTEINKVVENKVKSVVNDPDVYEFLGDGFIHIAAMFLPIETGALAFGTTGTPKGRDNVKRVGHNYVRTGGHEYGIVFDPVEHYTPKTTRGHIHHTHYGEKAILTEYESITDFKDAVQHSGLWQDFLKNAGRVMSAKMRRA